MFKCTKIGEIGRRIAPGDMLAFGYTHSGYEELFAGLSEFHWDHSVQAFIPCVFRYREEDMFPLDKISTQFSGQFLVTQIAPAFAGTLKTGKVDILPLPLSQLPRYLKEQSKTRKVWVFCEISPPDGKGFCSTGYSAPFPLSLIKDCEVVGLVNEKMPATYGDTAIPAQYINHFIEIPNRLPLFPALEVSDITRQLGHNVGQLVDNDTTIEGGIGETVSAVLSTLGDKKNLRFQSGIIVEDVRGLVEKGVIVDRSVCNVTGARSADFYEWIRMNPALEIRTMEYTHNINEMAKQPGFTAIGAALAVDLLGQVASETIGSQQITGVGGALDFARAAGMGDGKSIIAITSTFGKKNASKIVPLFEKGDVVTMTRYDVDYVVTEYGIAELKYQSRRNRALNLIRVAHPDHRDALTEKARQAGILS
jgi:4-hydroxybutyrate CoA-transferase